MAKLSIRKFRKKTSFNPVLFKRFLPCISGNKVAEMLDTLNSFHNKLQFTQEKQKKTINFLDMALILGINKIL